MRVIDADFMSMHYASMLLRPTPDVTKQDKAKAQIILDALKMERTIDIVRCKECKYWVNGEDYACEKRLSAWKADDFCSYGERTEQ